jgi:hypothetical protein
MADDKSRSGSPDRYRIDLTEDYEIQFWTRELTVSERQLRAAIEAVGDTSKAVREHLGK